MNLRKRQQENTRRAILDALGQQIGESGAIGFSIQDVADRAGVTHRTVYNYFPTREALNDAFAVHVEEELATLFGARPEEGVCLAQLPSVALTFYRTIVDKAAHVRAYVMLMIASRSPAQVTRERTKQFEQLMEDEAGPLPEGVARLATAAVRLFASSIGWHVLTEHQGLSNEDAARTAEWAAKVLLDAVANGDFPIPETTNEPCNDD
jgi:AcrR family transcriptional regulator